MPKVMTRSSVLVKTRYNVTRNPQKSATDLGMSDGWYDRFVAAIEADERDLKAISLQARCGENYVQQMIKDGKRPGVDRFMRILEVLGSAPAFYVLTGLNFSAEDEAFFRAAASLDPVLKEKAYDFFRTLQEKANNSKPRPDLPG